MNRRTFLKRGCIASIRLGFLSTAVESCSPVKYVSGSMNDNGIVVDLKEFEMNKKGYFPYVIVRHDSLQFPICVYRISAVEYSALLMRCSHQGAELQVAGDRLVCPAHGSEFDKKGKTTQPPAATDLRSFPVTIKNDQLFIDLRKQA
jgi:nitrite reductase/ring-hydroxylating ferredoxin subunit